MRDRYDYAAHEEPGWPAGEPTDWSGRRDADPATEPAFDYHIWPPEPPEPGAARDQNLRRLARLTWRAAQLGAVAAAAFAILFVRSAPTQNTTSQSAVRPAGTLTPPPSPTPSSPRPHHRARVRGADDPAPSPAPDAAAARVRAASASPTLAPPTTPPAPSPSPAQSTSSGSHSGG
jgi:hypothetical protein